jgi:hypothetical protein
MAISPLKPLATPEALFHFLVLIWKNPNPESESM